MRVSWLLFAVHCVVVICVVIFVSCVVHAFGVVVVVAVVLFSLLLV